MSMTPKMWQTAQTDKKLLERMYQSAQHQMSPEEVFEQKVSWAYSCTKGMTKDEVRRILSRT